jgi:hypothetical protein
MSYHDSYDPIRQYNEYIKQLEIEIYKLKRSIDICKTRIPLKNYGLECKNFDIVETQSLSENEDMENFL